MRAGAAALGATALGMHVEPLLRTLRADALSPPKRLLIFFTPLGAIRDAWLPQGTETDFQLQETLLPLERHKSEIIICKGINQQREIYKSRNHGEMGGILTGMRVDGDNETSSHTNISVDQFIASNPAVRGRSPFSSISLAAWQGRYQHFEPMVDHMYMSALGPGMAVVPEGLPQAAFDRFFGGFTAAQSEDGVPDPRIAARASVLDMVTKELQALRPSLGGRQLEKVDQHLTSVRELELRMMTMTPTSNAACSPGSRPSTFEVDDDDTLDQRFLLQLDLAIAALACDRTRVVALTAEGGRSGARHPWLGSTSRLHEVTHEPHFKEQMTVTRWYAEQFAYLLDRLRAIPEANGSLLDNTCVAWVTEQGLRTPDDKHSRTNMPYIIAGRCGGSIRPGRFIDFKGIESNSFLITLMNAMGISGMKFGKVSAEPLPGVVV